MVRGGVRNRPAEAGHFCGAPEADARPKRCETALAAAAALRRAMANRDRSNLSGEVVDETWIGGQHARVIGGR